MRAATHRFAMGVEDQRGDVGEAIGCHRIGEPPVQPLDRERGGNLADETARVGKAGLDRDAAARAGIVAVGGLAQQGFEETPAMFHRGFRLEQGRDVDLVGDAEQFREIERGEHGLRLLALSDEHADRRVGVDVLDDLRHREELPDGGGALDGERGEIAAQWLDLVK